MMSLFSVFLFLHYVTVSRSDQFQVVGPDGPLVVEAGEDLILPCSLKPNISAVDMTVEWFRLHTSDSLVHLYENGVDNNKNQIKSYRERTSLFKEELQKGNTSLKLSRVKTTDEGQYKCSVESEDCSDDVTIQVNVTAVGTQPVISMEGYSIGKGFSLLCESSDWWPEPAIVWLDNDGNPLPAEDTETLRDPGGFRVKKRVTAQDGNTNRFYCRVTLRNHRQEAVIVISKSVSESIFHTWRTAVAWISVAVIVIITGLIGLFLCIYRMKGFDKEKQNAVQNAVQNVTDKLCAVSYQLCKDFAAEIQKELNHKRQTCTVDVTLDPDTAHPNLFLSDDGKQVMYEDRQKDLRDKPHRFDCHPGVLGKEGFSSQRFYYEVDVSKKGMWELGVARELVNTHGKVMFNPENGYWTVRLEIDYKFTALDSIHVQFSLRQRPKTVGVFVDYEDGLVSFYDVGNNYLIYSFTGQIFTKKLYPYFSPSDGPFPLIITAVNQTLHTI